MFKKVLVVSLLGILLTTSIAGAVTLKDFFQKPLPSVVEFMNRVIDWLSWFWSKTLYYTDIVLNWTLDVALIKTWKFFLWLWNLVKTGILTGWSLIDTVARGLSTGSGIDWANIQWPWE